MVRRIVVLILVLAAFADLNPSSRRVYNSYASNYQEIRFILRQQSASAIFVSPRAERPINFYVFDTPVFRDNISVFAHASLGAEFLASFLSSRGVSHVLAEVSETGRPYLFGYVQNAYRMTTFLDGHNFEPVSSPVEMYTFSDEGSVEKVRRIQLLQVIRPPNGTLNNEVYLAQYVSKPILEVANPVIERQEVSVEWATHPSLTLQTEALPSDVVYPTPPQVELVVSLLPPVGSTSPLNISLTSPVETVVVQLISEPISVRVRSRMYESILLTTDSPCNPGNSPELGALIGRPICYGIGNFAVLQIGR